MKRQLFFIAVATVMPGLASAHGLGAGSNFQSGLLHPLTGADHLAAMLALGLLAGSIGGRAIWAVPLCFLAAMLGGAMLGAGGTMMPGTEQVILASVIVLGVTVALALRPSAILLGAMAIIFGAAHGFAHGSEAPAGSMALFASGFVTGSAGLILAGIVLAKLIYGRGFQLAGGALSLLGLGVAFAG
ncbi:HupE/UreJ family protein [Paracoccus albus]|uniref:HupE/UreJ family protein n=1 Tax=Paracoccus albus TaxID=3017784 RepID=UPI0022F04F2E|nr:HupE/UreJ family protein [Paracoccus albus]WBU61503.1 HupE/UreJ family protein [Paracoccus albus]